MLAAANGGHILALSAAICREGALDGHNSREDDTAVVMERVWYMCVDERARLVVKAPCTPPRVAWPIATRVVVPVLELVEGMEQHARRAYRV